MHKSILKSLSAVVAVSASVSSLKAPTAPPNGTLSDLITANHILHDRSILDSFGHVSIRHPNDSSVYIMASDAANIVASASDLYYYRVNDSLPLSSDDSVSHRSERFIHGELMHRFSSIDSVVHSHAIPVLPYATSEVPLLPVYHMAAFLGLDVPVWDITPMYTERDRHDMLVDSAPKGEALAAAFGNRSATSQNVTYPLVLQRYHGFTTAATSLENAVYQAIYATDNAEVQSRQLELKKNVGNGTGSELQAQTLNQVQVETGLGPDDYAFRAWRGFAYEVRRLPQYENSIIV